MKIPLSSPDIDQQDRDAVLETLESTALSLGPKLPEFEQAVAAAAGTRYAVAVNSGTSGLHLCVKAAQLGPGDEVITTPFSFVASANCILFERATPVFVDVDPVTYNIVPAAIESAITERTKAILPVHVFGRMCDMESIMRIAGKHGLTVIEDSCEAIGARYRGKPAGSFGQTGVFAFYPNKQITTGEGGAIVTDDAAVAQACRSWRNQGRAPQASWLEHEMLGYNYRLSDINCALGITQLRRLDSILEARRNVARLYNEALAQIPEIVPPRIQEPDSEISWFVYVVRLADEFSREDRDGILSELSSRGIGCRNYFSPIHLQPFYVEQFGYARGRFPVTEHIADRTIALPFFNKLSEAQVQQVCSVLRDAIHGVRSRRHVAVGALASA